MTKSLDNLCACGCGFPAREHSKYHSEKHQQAYHRRKLRDEADTFCDGGPRHYNKPHRNNHQVLIIDPLVATPYYIPKAEWDSMGHVYREMGCEAILGSQEIML
jgi:hypothetical protein